MATMPLEEHLGRADHCQPMRSLNSSILDSDSDPDHDHEV